jgi:hypothetical protein
MEYSMATDYVRVYHEKVDAYLQPIGFDFSRLLYVNAPTASPHFAEPAAGRWAEEFVASHELDYDYEDNLGMGNRSGSFIVTDVNKLAGVDCMLGILELALKRVYTATEVNSGNSIRLFNLGDDNLFVFKSQQEALAVLKFLTSKPEVFVRGFKVGVEPAPSFLKYYVMYRNNRYEFVKDASTFLSNLVVSENGTQTTREDLDRLGKPDDVDPGIGYFARLLDYSSNELCLDVLRPLYEKLLQSELSLKPKEAYPTSDAELKRLVESLPAEDTGKDVSAMEYLLKLNPDYIYYKLDALDIPDELIDKMFLHIKIEELKQIHPNLPYKYKSRLEAAEEHPRPTFPLLDLTSRQRALKIIESYMNV